MTAHSDISIASTALQTAMQAVRQPREPLIRCRIRDGCLEVAAVDEQNSVLSEARIPHDSGVDSSGFAVDRRSLKRLAAQSDDSVQVCFDEEMIAARASGHVYSSLTGAEKLDLCPLPYPADPAIKMETTPPQLWDLIGRVGSSCVAFSGEGGEMWLSGKKGPGSLYEGTVRIPDEHTTVPAAFECVSLISKKLLRRELRQILDDGVELTVVVGHDVPVVLEWEMSGVECRQAIAPRIPDGSSWDVKAEVSL